MKTKQYKALPNSLKFSTNTKGIAQLLAIGTIATGTLAVMSAAPASAAIIQTGKLGFTDGTDAFASTFSLGTSFSVNFDPAPATARINVATGDFAPLFTVGQVYPVATATGSFDFVGGNTYRLANDLPFNFTGQGLNVIVSAGSLFNVTTNNEFEGVTLASSGAAGSIVNADGSVAARQLAFSFNDIPESSGGGNYGFLVSPTAVPEPFTIIGTLVGGTAALRMRKKLADASKH